MIHFVASPKVGTAKRHCENRRLERAGQLPAIWRLDARNRLATWVALVALARCQSSASVNAIASRSDGKFPLLVVSITIPKSALNQYVSRIKTFAARNSFTIRVSHRSPYPEDILVRIWREDVEMIGRITQYFFPTDADANSSWIKFGIGIYQSGDDPVSPAALLRLTAALQHGLAEICGAKVAVN